MKIPVNDLNHRHELVHLRLVFLCFAERRGHDRVLLRIDPIVRSVNLTDTSVKKIRSGLSSAVPRRSVEISKVRLSYSRPICDHDTRLPGSAAVKDECLDPIVGPDIESQTSPGE